MKSNFTAVFDSYESLADALSRMRGENCKLEDISVIHIFENDSASGTVLRQKPMDTWELASEFAVDITSELASELTSELGAIDDNGLTEEDKIPRATAIPGCGNVPAGFDDTEIYDLDGAVTVSDNILVPGIGIVSAGGPVFRILASDPYNGLDKWLSSVSPSFKSRSVLRDMLLKHKLILHANTASENAGKAASIIKECGGFTVA